MQNGFLPVLSFLNKISTATTRYLLTIFPSKYSIENWRNKKHWEIWKETNILYNKFAAFLSLYGGFIR